VRLLYDARRIRDLDPSTGASYWGDQDATCFFCQEWIGKHAESCPWLSMSRVVEVLEAAARIAGNSPEDETIHGPYGCHFCGGTLQSYDTKTFPETGHDATCPWVTLVRALREEEL
jgi:hypothetical protein